MQFSRSAPLIDDHASLEVIVSRGPGLMCLLEANGRFRSASPELCTLLGVGEPALIGTSWFALLDDADARDAEPETGVESRVSAAADEVRWLKWSITRLASGRRLCVAQDVTTSKHAVHRVATVLSVMRALAIGHDARAIPRAIEAICDTDGWIAGELWWLGDAGAMSCLGAWPPAASTPAAIVSGQGPIGTAWATGEVWFGMQGPRTIAAIPILDGYSVIGMLALHGDPPRTADEPTLDILRYVALQIGRVVRRWTLATPPGERHARTWSGPTAIDDGLRAVLAYAPMVLFTLDADGRFTSLGGDPHTLTALGLHGPTADVLGTTVFERCGPLAEFCESCRLALAGHEHAPTFAIDEGRYYARFVALRDPHGPVTGAVGVIFDITSRAVADATFETTRARAIAADRLAALGSLAGSVANEINNAITAARLSLGRLISFDLSRQPMTPNRLHRIELLQDAREGIARVEKVTQELHAFSHDESPAARTEVDVREVIDAVVRLAHHEIKHRARVITTHGEVPRVWAAADRLKQAFLNLVLHAVHAIAPGEAHLHELRIATSTDAAGRAVVEVHDDGVGLTHEQLDAVFEPSFHPGGRWSGLGLAICRDTIVALDGELTIASEVDRGTTIRVALPIGDEPFASVSPPVVVASPAERAMIAGPGRILIVDDDRPVAAAVALELDEFDVVVAGSGREALEILGRDDRFDLVLCDLMMPEVTGMDLFEAVRAASPAIAERFVFMTGGAFTERAAAFVRDVPNLYVDKPFNADDLRALVRSRVPTTGPEPVRHHATPRPHGRLAKTQHD